MLTTSKSQLAINGGEPAVREPLQPFKTVGLREAEAAYDAIIDGPLSGYLGGQRKGGYHVEALEAAWCEMFDVKHAVACNSATSGILIACMAAGVGYERSVIYTTPYTMSGTVAPAAILGAKIEFGDIDPETFCLQPSDCYATITVNLFGHPADINPKGFTIVDAAQSILASRDSKRVSGNVTVFSGNVHKAVQCGEGGMCVTNNDALADGMRFARNHGELHGCPAGLNLRLTEVHAAIWLVQLKKAEWIVSSRVETAKAIIAAAAPLLKPPLIRQGCTHSFYTIAWVTPRIAPVRNQIVAALNAEGFPCRAGYVEPLYNLPAFQQDIRRPNVEEVEASIITYENCCWDPTSEQIKQIGEAFRKVADAI